MRCIRDSSLLQAEYFIAAPIAVSTHQDIPLWRMGPSSMDPPNLLFNLTPHDSPPPLSLSLLHSFSLSQHHLTPPFPLFIPSPSQYTHLTLALLTSILTSCDPQPHLTHLHSLVTDSYSLLTSTLLSLSHHHFHHLLPTPRTNLLSLTSNLVHVSAVSINQLLISLLRLIITGDFSQQNLFLCRKLINIFTEVEEQPLSLTSGVYVFLRLLADHWRVDVGELKRMEVEFCVEALRECFGLCLGIGRDLVRLLQDVVRIPEIGEVWKDLLFKPSKFGVVGFTDVAQLYCRRTPSCYFLLRIGTAMETQLRFLMTHVKWGNQKRYQAWFAKKHLGRPGSESVIVDIVRFVCCGHHPSNEIIQSDVISRWAVIGWLLKCCKVNYVEANVKFALFYDWLFFDEKLDKIMNIEPVMLLMVNSLPRYVDITHTLLEFLFLLVDNYDVHRREMVVKGVSASFSVLVRKGVVTSLDPLTSCSLLSSELREKLNNFIVPGSNSGVVQKS